MIRRCRSSAWRRFRSTTTALELVRRNRNPRLLLHLADALPPVPGTPPPALLRLTHALSDESRLRILRYLAAGERSFTEVVREIGLAKSTVHHHLVALRAAGLVRVRHDAANAVGYGLRADALDDLDARLTSFLHD